MWWTALDREVWGLRETETYSMLNEHWDKKQNGLNELDMVVKEFHGATF